MMKLLLLLLTVSSLWPAPCPGLLVQRPLPWRTSSMWRGGGMESAIALRMSGDENHSSMRITGKGDSMREYKLRTKVARGGQQLDGWTTDPLGRSFVNPPVYRASTITYPSMSALREALKDYPFRGLSYGRHGTPTSFALEEAFAILEGGDNACVVSSGLAAINAGAPSSIARAPVMCRAHAAILAFVSAGDHILVSKETLFLLLVSDGVYDPTRGFCDKFLKRFGVSTTYFDPLSTGEELGNAIQPNTRVLFLESPSSLSFEIHDFEALTRVARERNVVVVADNTYGPGLFRPMEWGAHVSINAATKYISGHSDVMIGLLACSKDTYRRVKRSVQQLGCPAGPDDCYLALRGFRTLSVRMKAHEEHHLWQKYFSGSSGLFTFQLKDVFSQEQVDTFCDSLSLFEIGYSWGGYESLVLPCDISSVRSVVPWEYGDGYGATIRLHIGLEDVEDLIQDLQRAFEMMGAPGKE
ncbi:hypothetical protein GUITHDRAFT_132564 [Guillardia theta CCMP2712]|uniref:Cystathionine beta-lyase n=1 Tax=Guillardia theta (strain CCMP2712) TaxID=905079 RepID=L1K1B1_GUITC|nr:hypothetical protein GUITHDRAFT_132564 [Guillardia theta CCMP2712]EKX54168.1 hypothetical protein GUITHDRAFT_132564 [Guillardia theta CCMP2712]|eukprot:XP_005841148.1 hypothetical protein GUITHDRAFT_132564 [Guillardia theta CCMP2712]